MASRILLFSLIPKHFLSTVTSSSSSAAATLSPPSSTDQFLMNSCGLSFEFALSFSQKFQHDENKIQKVKSVIRFLKSHHFNDSHVMKLMEKQPQFLYGRVEDNLKPKFDFLVANGFVGQHLPRLIISNPTILQRSLHSHIMPCFELLKSALGSDEKIVAAIKRSSWLLSDFRSTMQPNIDFLIKEGVPVDRVAKLIEWQPRVIQQKHDRVVYSVNSLKHFGLEPKANVFVHALRVMTQLSESNWKKKVEAMKSLGWSEEEILGAFKRKPQILGFSEKRIRQRGNVVKVLQSERLINGYQNNIGRFLKMSEEKFVENYIAKFVHKVPGLLEIYGDSGKEEKADA